MHVIDVKCCNIDVIKCNYMVLHPASIVYMTDYILPLFITWHITSCVYSLQVSLHPASIDYMFHYMLPNQLHALGSITSITCSQIHYMRPVFTVVNQWAAGRAISSDAAIAVSPGWRD